MSTESHPVFGDLTFRRILGWTGTYEDHRHLFMVRLQLEPADFDEAARRFQEILGNVESVELAIIESLYAVYVRDAAKSLSEQAFRASHRINSIMLGRRDDKRLGVTFLFTTPLFGGHDVQVTVSPDNKKVVSLVG